MNSSLLWEFNIDDVYALKNKLERIIVLKIKWLKTRISLLFIYLWWLKTVMVDNKSLSV